MKAIERRLRRLEPKGRSGKPVEKMTDAEILCADMRPEAQRRIIAAFRIEGPRAGWREYLRFFFESDPEKLALALASNERDAPEAIDMVIAEIERQDLEEQGARERAVQSPADGAH